MEVHGDEERLQQLRATGSVSFDGLAAAAIQSRLNARTSGFDQILREAEIRDRQIERRAKQERQAERQSSAPVKRKPSGSSPEGGPHKRQCRRQTGGPKVRVS